MALLCEQFITDPLKKNLCLALVTESDEIAAVAINDCALKDEEDAYPVTVYEDRASKAIIGLFERENERANLFEQFQVDKIFDFKIISVDSQFRDQGLAKKLLTETETLAKSLGFKIIKSDLTSKFSQQLTKGFGWKLAVEAIYKDYVDSEQNIFIRTQPPHESYQLRYKILD